MVFIPPTHREITSTMSHLNFAYANSTETPPSPTTTSFQVTAKPNTDVWRKHGPPEVSRFSAPILYKAIPISSFKRVRVTVSANWNSQDDHGGLIFVLPQADGSKKWIKTGIELVGDQTFIATASADRGADMSLLQTGLKGEKKNEVALEMINEKNALWIYVVDGQKRVPIREVTWAFSGSEEGRECWVGVLAARPSASPEGDDTGLVVDFKDFELDVV